MAALDTSTSTEVPGLLPVAIAGHAYQVDVRGYKRESVPVLRQQADTSEVPGENSLNPKGLWLRSQESWHHGAGQTFFDGRTSRLSGVVGAVADPERFFTSSGCDVWTRGQVSLLNQTVRVRTLTDFKYGPICAAADHLYVGDDQQVYWSSNPTTSGATWTSAVINAGQAAQTVQSLASNGYYVWAALGSSGLHRTIKGASTSTADVPAQACTLVGYALGRLLIANANSIWEILSPITAPVAPAVPLFTHPDANFVWQGFSPGRTCIYAYGNTQGTAFGLNYGYDQGGNAEVYRISLVDTNTNLGAPVMATYLPDGESIYNVQFYAGGVILATGRGFRLGIVDGPGNIDYGPLIESTRSTATGYVPVVAIEPQGRYVWYTGGESLGLNRADLGFQTDTLVPSYAADLDVFPYPGSSSEYGITRQAVSLVTPPNPVFTYYQGVLSGGTNESGVYRATTTKVASGTLETGQIRFGTTASKTLRRLDIRHLPLPAGASILCELKRDGGSWTTIGTSNTTAATAATFDVGSLAAETIELRFTLGRATDTTTGPTLTRWTLMALPTPRRDEAFTLPLMLRASDETSEGVPYPRDIPAELSFLRTLWLNGTVFTLQIGAENLSATIQDFQFEGESMSPPTADSNGYGPRRFVQGKLTLLAQTVGA